MSRAVNDGQRSGAAVSPSTSAATIEVAAGDGADLIDTWNSYIGDRKIVIPKGLYTLSSQLLVPNAMTHKPLLVEGVGGSGKVTAETANGTTIKGGAGLAGVPMIAAADPGTATDCKLFLRDIRLEGTGNEQMLINWTGYKPFLTNVVLYGSMEAYGTGARNQYLMYGATSGDRSDPGEITGIQTINKSKLDAVVYLKGENIRAGSIFCNVANTADAGCLEVLHLENSVFGANVENFRAYVQGGADPVTLVGWGGYYGSHIGTIGVTHDSTATLTNMFAAGARAGTLHVDHVIDSMQYNSALQDSAVTVGKVMIDLYVKRFLGASGSVRTFQPGAAYAEYDSPNCRATVDVTHFASARVLAKGGSNSGDATAKGVCIYNETGGALMCENTWTDNVTTSYRDGAWTDITALSGSKLLSLRAKTKAATDYAFGTNFVTQLELSRDLM